MSLRSDLRSTLISHLKETMAKKGISNSKLAPMIGVDARTIAKWKSGETFSIDGIDTAFAAMGVNILVSTIDFEDFVKTMRKPLAEELGYTQEGKDQSDHG